MKCEALKAVREIGLEPESSDHCESEATVNFQYRPWRICEEHAGQALFAGLNRAATALDRCAKEIARCEAELRAGNPDIEGCALGLMDWSAERRLIAELMDLEADR